MFFEHINYVTVIISAIVSLGLGYLWYSPYLFADRWMKEMNFPPEKIAELKASNTKSGMIKKMSTTIALGVVMAFVVAALLNSLIVVGFGGLFLFAFLMWLGFSLPVTANISLYGMGSIALFAIDSGYQLACILLTTLIVGIWG